MKKRFILPILMLIFVLSSVLFIGTACSNDKGDNDETNNEIYSIYTTYVAYAEENGQAPLTYEEWLASVKGEKGETGANGVDGVSPKLQINTTTNMWEVSYDNGKTWISLNVKATGSNGTNGTNGTNGVDGVSPKLQINATTNMWEISYDNGKTWTSLNVKATGSNGTNGTNGTNGVDGVSPKLQINTTTNMWEVSYDTLAIGDYYTLPIPSSLKAGESFQGWYNGNEKVTDAQGKSFKKCIWDSTVTLTAAYYTEISTIYEFMDLAGKDLVGKYIITQDLDFKRLGVNCINSLTGIFDGDGHTLKNFTLSTDASYNTYSGLFKTVKRNSTICNIVFENVNCSEQYASGLIGVAYAFNTTIDNITIKNSFHNNMKSIMIGTIVGVTEKDIAYNNKIIVGEIFLNNIFIKNSGEKVNTYGIYNLKATGINTSQGYYDDYYPIVNINKFQIDGNNAQTQNSAGVLYTTEKSLSGFNITCTTVEKPTINIKHYVLNIDIDYGIAPETMYTRTITVSQSEIHSKTKKAWSMVTLLEDSIHTGTTQSWGAEESIRCIDAGSEFGTYDLGKISSSIILYPDANGVFTYYSASGTMATFNDVSLIDKDLFVSMLGFDSTVWDLDNIDIENGIYPTIRK